MEMDHLPIQARARQVFSRGLFLGALLLLLLNDGIFKYVYANALTGKLSDFAGLFIMAGIVLVISPRRCTLGLIIVAGLFAWWKSPYSQGLIDLAQASGLPIGRVIDPTDLLALSVLPVGAWLLRPTLERAPSQRKSVLAVLSSVFVVLALTGTSFLPLEDEFSIRKKEEGAQVPRDEAVRILEMTVKRNGFELCEGCIGQTDRVLFKGPRMAYVEYSFLPDNRGIHFRITGSPGGMPFGRSSRPVMEAVRKDLIRELGSGISGMELVADLSQEYSVYIPEPPHVLGGLSTYSNRDAAADQWRQRRAPMLLETFQSTMYGRLPGKRDLQFEAHQVLDPKAYNGLASLEEVTIRYSQPETHIHVAYAVPAAAGPHPVMIAANFCGNRRAFGADKVTAPAALPTHCTGTGPDVPVDMLLKRGYAVATFWTGDVVPDDPEAAAPKLQALTTATRPEERLGAIAAWGWGFSKVIDYLETDPRFDPAAEAIYGHSRNGKAALAAAAFDPRIDLVFAHQSGRGGSSLSRSPAGESVAAITSRFPHWFAPNYATFSDDPARLPIDQHMLLGLIAPRLVLLGAGTQDEWADPEGAWQAAFMAKPVYQILGHQGIEQRTRETPNLKAEVAYFLRPGGHGTTPEDWQKLADFMDAHLRTGTGPRSAQ